MTVILTRDEAQACVERIRSGIEGIRAEVLRLHEGEGWRVLGYASWRECVTAEFGGSERRLYQLLDAALIQRTLTADEDNSRDATVCTNVQTEGTSNSSPDATVSPIGETVAIPESVLRPLKPLLNDPDAMRQVWQETVAEHGPEPSAAQVTAKVAAVMPRKMTPGERDRQEAIAHMAESQRVRDEQQRMEALARTGQRERARNSQIERVESPNDLAALHKEMTREPENERRFRELTKSVDRLIEEHPVARYAEDAPEYWGRSALGWLDSLGEWSTQMREAIASQLKRPMKIVK